jgi:hypothetical protein
MERGLTLLLLSPVWLAELQQDHYDLSHQYCGPDDELTRLIEPEDMGVSFLELEFSFSEI